MKPGISDIFLCERSGGNRHGKPCMSEEWHPTNSGSRPYRHFNLERKNRSNISVDGARAMRLVVRIVAAASFSNVSRTSETFKLGFMGRLEDGSTHTPKRYQTKQSFSGGLNCSEGTRVARVFVLGAEEYFVAKSRHYLLWSSSILETCYDS